jgi:hypothetical protein
MSQSNYLKSGASIVAKRDPWHKDHSLVVDMCFLALKSSKNDSKSLNRDDWHSNKGANKARAMFDNKMSKSPI